jgi:hypothetical protein
MRLLLTLLGVLAILLGLVWILQGFDLFPGHSVMNGDRKWALYGGCLAFSGFVLMGFSSRLGARRRSR